MEAVLEECLALIKQIVADLSGEKPFADETSATELLSYLERATSALKKSVSRSDSRISSATLRIPSATSVNASS